MIARFKALAFLCWLQTVFGGIVIALSVLVPTLVLATGDGNSSGENAIIVIACGIGGMLFGLSLIAMAQVYQCLMQIEINTRPTQLEAEPAMQVASGISDNRLAAPAL